MARTCFAVTGGEFRLVRLLCMHSAEPVLLWSEPWVWGDLWLLRVVLIMSMATEYGARYAGGATIGHLPRISYDTATRSTKRGKARATR
jgi:hypothetical protein